MIDVTTQRGRATTQFIVYGTIEQLRDRVRAIVDQDRRFRWRAGDNSRIILTTRPNWATWGETITLSFGAAGSTRTSVNVRAKPRLATTVLDWGQGARTIRFLYEQLTATTG
ncbi:hypothetical protein [Curtobacterium ammoniigenes]|uniref:hypothetical protein n=1 Tax=Curtobacterium ammoniigenes TaxID=395387 RepID=UPI00083177FD|nr:hypothetical protein [Curtobacterium ammoniigenes]